MNRSPAAVVFAALAILISGVPAGAQDDTSSAVTVLQTGGTVMYKFRDEYGQIVIQDRPPPGYFEQFETAAPEDAEAGREPAPLGVAPAPLPPSLMERAARVLLWLLPFAPLAVGVYLLSAPLIRARVTESALARSLRRAGFPAFFDVAVSAGPRSRAQIDCLACTPSGILVLGKIALNGQVRGRPDDAAWTVTGRNGTEYIDNPLKRNDADTKVVQELLGDVPLHGRVVYTGRAKFAGGTPARLQWLPAFRDNLRHFTVDAAPTRSQEAGWRTLMRFPRSNAEQPRPFGAGWQGWLRRHWRAVAGGVLISLSASSAVALLLSTGGAA